MPSRRRVAVALLLVAFAFAPSAALARTGFTATEPSSGTWTTPVDIDPSSTYDVSCASAKFCAEIDYDSNAFVYQGGRWVYYSYIDPHGSTSLSTVSCATSTFCMAVDDHGYAVQFNGHRWLKPVSIDPEAGMREIFVSCPTTTFCAALDSFGYAVLYDGHSWSQAEKVDETDGLSVTGLSCGSPHLCVGVDWNNNYVAYNGKTWSVPQDTGLLLPRRISCAPRLCASVDTFGNVATYSNGAWSARYNYDGSNFANTVACTSRTFCMIVDNGGQQFLYDGATWSGPVPVKLYDPVALSCASYHFCTLFGQSGEYSFYND